jgi:hypothetical protein
MRRSQLLCTCAALLQAAYAFAEQAPDPLTDRLQLTVGWFHVSTEPTIHLQGAGQGGRLDWEREFGGLDTFRIRVDGRWRFSERHGIRASFFGASRRHDTSLEHTIEWGDAEYPVNALVESEFKFSVVDVAYEYALLRRQSYELAACLGLHYTSLKATLEAEADLSNGTLSQDVTETARLTAPLPMIGFRGTWSIWRAVSLDASARFFSMTVDKYDGSLHSYSASLTWQPRSWLGIGVSYTSFGIDVDTDSRDLRGTLDWLYQGPMLFYRASF